MPEYLESLLFAGVSKWLMRDYLRRMDYQEVNENHFIKHTNHVFLDDAEPHRVGNLKINRILVKVQGQEKDSFDNAVAAIRLKAMRGGG